MIGEHNYELVWLEDGRYARMLERDFGYQTNGERTVWLQDLPMNKVQALLDAIESLDPYHYTVKMNFGA